MATFGDLEREAEKQGKVGYFTWQQARRQGVDPASLVETERKQYQELERDRSEYEQYVVGEGVSAPVRKRRTRKRAQQANDLMRRWEVVEMLEAFAEKNRAMGLEMPDEI